METVTRFDTVVANPKKGRCAVLQKRNGSHNVRPGDEILKVTATSRPVLFERFWDSKCGFCLENLGAQGSGRGRCSKCGLVHYCCREHQKLDFYENHKKECKFLAEMSQRFKSRLEDTIMLGRILRAGEKTWEKVEDMVLVETPSGNRLRENDTEIAKFILTKYNKMIDQEKMSLERATDILQRFALNNFGIVNQLHFTVAAGCFPLGAILNHSCDPNCTLSYHFDSVSKQTFQVMRATKIIEPGDELCHAYYDTINPTAQRQAYFQDIYGFSCDCDFCSGTCTQRLTEIEPRLEKIIQMPLETSLSIFNQRCVPKGNDFKVNFDDIVLTQVVSDALTFGLESGQMDLAKLACKWLVGLYKLIYPQFHPLIGLQLYTLIDLSEPNPSQDDVEQAIQIFSVTEPLGIESPFVKDLQARIFS